MSVICDKRHFPLLGTVLSEIAQFYRDNLTAQRKHLLETLGGLPEAIVHNDEWLSMLEEETRNSVAIEGYFATEQELKAVLKGRKTVPEILNYYRAAQGLYDLASQYYRARGTARCTPGLACPQRTLPRVE